MIKKKMYLPVILSVLLVISSLQPAAVYGMSPTRAGSQPVSKTPTLGTKTLNVQAVSDLAVDSTKTAADLAQMLVGNSVTIKNLEYTGAGAAKGTFSGGADIIGFEEGILLSSGDIHNVIGPNEKDNISKEFDTEGDADLGQLIGNIDTNDAAVLEFDFVPDNDVISFTYVFASEEYNEFVYQYNDVFGFFVNGKNVALIPGTQTPVSIDNVNGGNPYGTNAKNSKYYRNNDLSDLGGSINTEMDGLTTVLHVEAAVNPGKDNHIKLAVADALDTELDSVVFIKAGSFDDKPVQYGDISFEFDNYSIDENIVNGYATISVVRKNGSDGEVTIDYSTSDSGAEAGKDYTAASGKLTFKDGETAKSFNIPIINDQDLENDEAVALKLENPAGGAKLGTYGAATLTIKDDEQPPQFTFSQKNYTVAETVYGAVYENKALITVNFTGFYPQPMILSEESDETVISVAYSTSNGTATAGSDYVPASGTLYFEPWETEKSFEVAVLADTKYEGNETVKLSLSNPSTGILGNPYEAVLTIIDGQSPPQDDDDDDGNDNNKKKKKKSGSSSSTVAPVPPSEVPPGTANLINGTIIDRMAGYITLSSPSKINEVKNEIELSYDGNLLKNNPAHTPRIYYWNAGKGNWVALATYPAADGKVKAVNDGEYKGWFVVFGVIEPEFSDVKGSWAEQIINRMNGLGMIEGYPIKGEQMLRTAKIEQNVSRAEFIMFVSRILNIDIDDPKLPLVSEEEARKLLNAKFTDSSEIPLWVLRAAGTLDKANIIAGEGSELRADAPISRVEAAVMISKALKLLTECKAADCSKYTDYSEIPGWAKGELVEGVMAGYPEGAFKPNGNLARSEALTMLYRLFVEGLGW